MIKDLLLRVLPELLKYKIFMRTGLTNINPFVLTFSVTAACQSLCKTCNIGESYRIDPGRATRDLKIDEIEKIFKSMRSVYFFNISGGEPYLRSDLPEIIELACRLLRPKIIHIPTNAIAVKTICEKTTKILEIIKSYQSDIVLTVKPSIDGIGDRHDEIRGVKGNFEKLLETIEALKELEQVYNNFYLELGTVVSNYNIDQLDQIEDFVHSLKVEGYRNEIAEQRAEFFNIGDPITPSGQVYEALMSDFRKKIIDNIASKHNLAIATEALRLVYYQLAANIIKQEKQVIPCYAGISNVHINYDGGVWPCCVLGYSKEFGNLRNFNYDFQKIWFSDEAISVRSYIKRKSCACPLANQAYSNILLDYKSIVKATYMAVLLRLKTL